MIKNSLSDEEVDLVKKVIQVVRPLLGRGARTRLGVSEESSNHILDQWPHIDDSSDSSDECVLINNSLNEMINGIRISDEDVQKLIGVNKETLKSIYKKWAKARGWNRTGIM
jgi:hypothetical protein